MIVFQQVDVLEREHESQQSKQERFARHRHAFAVEHVFGRMQPEQHGQPVQADDQQHPVFVHGCVGGQRNDPGSDGAQTPQELRATRKNILCDLKRMALGGGAFASAPEI